jgi:transcriptional regulator with XRE-family HTH domain
MSYLWTILMSKPSIRTYSRHSREAVYLLGRLIRSARKQHKLTLQEVADRAGISRGLLQRIEKGESESTIGVVFEVATIVGVNLFEADQSTLTKHIHQTEEKLALLPKAVRKKKREVDDDF